MESAWFVLTVPVMCTTEKLPPWLTGHEKEGDRAADAFLARIRAVPERAGGPTFYFEHSADPMGRGRAATCHEAEGVRAVGR